MQLARMLPIRFCLSECRPTVSIEAGHVGIGHARYCMREEKENVEEGREEGKKREEKKITRRGERRDEATERAKLRISTLSGSVAFVSR